MTAQDTFKIEQVISRFATSFDLKDWDGLRDCLADPVFTDYTDLRGTPPANVSADEYVASRRHALEQAVSHHLGGNYETAYVDARHATCRASMVIWRKAGEEQFTTHCVYLFRLEKIGSDWKISGITQKVLWNEGNPAIHPGAK
jgi:hypothetical protein